MEAVAAQPSPSRLRRALMLSAVMLGAAVYEINLTTVTVALPPMQGSFSATPDQVAWIVPAFVVGMTMGLTPITGLPLPFVSYGGSSLVSSYAALALVARGATQRVSVLSPRELEPAAPLVPVPAAEHHRAKRLVSIWRD